MVKSSTKNQSAKEKKKYNRIFSLKNKHQYFTASKLKNIEAKHKATYDLDKVTTALLVAGIILTIICIISYVFVYEAEWLLIPILLGLLLTIVGYCIF
ncbi:MAG: hypothetical protein SGJ04_01870 [Bacteroidota bacterium]|nr:hypothetical protein [Bacteroidota bacterium]